MSCTDILKLFWCLFISKFHQIVWDNQFIFWVLFVLFKHTENIWDHSWTRKLYTQLYLLYFFSENSIIPVCRFDTLYCCLQLSNILTAFALAASPWPMHFICTRQVAESWSDKSFFVYFKSSTFSEIHMRKQESLLSLATNIPI